MATYSFLNINAAITGPGGSINLGAGAAVHDEGISTEMLEDKTTMTIGADGAVMHALHAGQGARWNVRLLKTSPVNAQLSAMYALQTSSSALFGVNVLSIRDVARGDSFTLSNAAFARFPAVVWSKEGAPMNEWQFLGTADNLLGSGELAA